MQRYRPSINLMRAFAEFLQISVAFIIPETTAPSSIAWMLKGIFYSACVYSSLGFVIALQQAIFFFAYFNT